MEKFPSCINIECFEKGKVTTRKIIVLKSYIILDFHSGSYISEIEKLDFNFPHFYILWKIIVQLNGMKCWVDTIILNTNEHVIIQKYARYLFKKFTHNTSLVVSQFIWRELHLSTLTNWNHPPYLWHIFILIYLMKFIRIIEQTNATHIFIIIQFILTKQTIYPLLTTIWYHTDDCTKQYRCESFIYLLSCLAL